MKKTEFLSELKKHISLLEDDEQQDIIDEYSQHIDNKVSKGMTEDEAIEDFGPFDQLMEELLGAYHVKASAVEKSSNLNAGSLVDGSKRAAEKAMNATKKGCSKLKRCWEELDGLANAKALAKGNAPEGEGEKPPAGSEPEQTSRAKAALGKAARTVKEAGNAAVQGGTSLGGSAFALTKTFIRWCWNFCVVCMVAGTVCCALGSLFCLGLCLVLLLQGYPLAGVSLAALGTSVALVCLSVLCVQLILIKKKPESGSRSANATQAKAVQTDVVQASITSPLAQISKDEVR